MKTILRKLRKIFIFKLISTGKNIPASLLEKYRESVYLNELIKDLKINCILDVGANTGQFATDLRHLGFKGKIISFEPIKTEFESLKQTFNGDLNWSGHQIALGSRNEKTSINVGSDKKLSSLLEFNFTDDKKYNEEIWVKRLDEIFDSFELPVNPKILLKIDTQGFDLEVFRGAKGILSKVTAIMSEISVKPLYEGMVDYKESLKIYEEAGFRLHNLSIVSFSSDKTVIEMNCLMKR